MATPAERRLRLRNSVWVGTPGAGGGVTPPTPAVGVLEDWFNELGSTSTWYASSTGPSGIRETTWNTSVLAIEEYGAGSVKNVRATGLNHDTKEWTTGGVMFVDISFGSGSQQEADDHGVGALAFDYQGYLHAFGGTHNIALIHSSSNAPRDISAFTVRSSDLGPDAYPHPIAVGNRLYLFTRYHPDNDTFDLSLRKTTALANGVPTWGARETVCTFGTQTRVYAGNPQLVGTDIYMPMTKGDFADGFREDIFAVIYDTLTGEKRNVAKTKTVAAGTPISASDMQAFFKVVDQVDGNETVTPSMIVKDGLLHIVWNDGVKDGTTATVKHKTINLMTGAESAVTNLGTTQSARSSILITENANGVEARWATNSGAVSQYQNAESPAVPYAVGGGDIWGASWTSAGGWGAASVQRACTRAHKLDGPLPIVNAHPEFRWAYAERASETAYRAGGNLRSYAYGDSGVVQRRWPIPAEVEAYSARLSAPLSDARKRRVAAMVRGHIACGAWERLDALYIGAKQATLGDALKNLKSSLYDQTILGGITFDATNGPIGDGTSGKTRTGYNPLTSGGQAAAASFSIFAWLRTNNQAAGADFGLNTVSGTNLRARTTANATEGRAASSAPVMTAAGLTNSRGEFALSRLDATGRMHRDGARSASATMTADISPNDEIVFHGSTTIYTARAHALEGFGRLIPDDPMGVSYQARKRFLLEEGVM